MAQSSYRKPPAGSHFSSSFVSHVVDDKMILISISLRYFIFVNGKSFSRFQLTIRSRRISNGWKYWFLLDPFVERTTNENLSFCTTVQTNNGLTKIKNKYSDIHSLTERSVLFHVKVVVFDSHMTGIVGKLEVILFELSLSLLW